MHFPKYVIGVFLPYALKNGCGEASFIKGPSMDGESYRPCFEFKYLIRVAWQRSFHQVIPDGVHPAWFRHHKPLSMLNEGSERCSIGISLPRSSCEAVASFAKALAHEFSALSTCLT